MHTSQHSSKIALQLDEELLKHMLRHQKLHVSDIHCIYQEDKARLQRLLIQALTEKE